MKLIGTSLVLDVVKKSLVQCFCQTCAASVNAKGNSTLTKNQLVTNAPQARPPKKVVLEYVATEVRASENAKGGIKYELVLAEPSVDTPMKASPILPKYNLSIEEIEKKLKAAEERRQQAEARKLTNINEQLSHLQEVQQKKQVHNTQFMHTAQESLQQRMETNKEKREAYIRAIQEKQRGYVARVQEVRKNLDAHQQEMLDSITKKLASASGVREAQLLALQKRLREHDQHVEAVRQNKKLHARIEASSG